jgi:hypothetical protein
LGDSLAKGRQAMAVKVTGKGEWFTVAGIAKATTPRVTFPTVKSHFAKIDADATIVTGADEPTKIYSRETVSKWAASYQPNGRGSSKVDAMVADGMDRAEAQRLYDLYIKPKAKASRGR